MNSSPGDHFGIGVELARGQQELAERVGVGLIGLRQRPFWGRHPNQGGESLDRVCSRDGVYWRRSNSVALESMEVPVRSFLLI